MKRALTAIALIAVFAMPAAAADCQDLTFDGGYITGRSGNVDTVRTGLIGPNLWVQVGEYVGQDEREATVSRKCCCPSGCGGDSRVMSILGSCGGCRASARRGISSAKQPVLPSILPQHGDSGAPAAIRAGALGLHRAGREPM